MVSSCPTAGADVAEPVTEPLAEPVRWADVPRGPWIEPCRACILRHWNRRAAGQHGSSGR